MNNSGTDLADIIDEISGGVKDTKKIKKKSKKKIKSKVDDYINILTDSAVGAILAFLIFETNTSIELINSVIPGMIEEIEEREVKTHTDNKEYSVTKSLTKKSTIKGKLTKCALFITLFSIYKAML